MSLKLTDQSMQDLTLPVLYKELAWQERRAVREEYVRRQKGLCQYCKEPLSGPPSEDILDSPINKRLFPKNFFNYPIHLHHDHHSGYTIGAVHSRCNAFLFEYEGE